MIKLLTTSTGTVHTSAKTRVTWIGDPDRHQSLIICSLAHCQSSLKISFKSVRKFLRKVANRQTDRQTGKQTNNDDYMTSVAEVINQRPCLWSRTLSCRLCRRLCIVPCGRSEIIMATSGYATWFTAGGCNPHRSLWRHWWRHNSETIRYREKRRPPRPMKSSELSYGENRIALRQLLQNR